MGESRNVIELPGARSKLWTWTRLRKAAISLGAGVLLFLSCAHFDIWPLAWIGVVPLLTVALDPTTRRPAVYGFLCGLTANGGGFYWVEPFLQRFGHLPFVAAAPIFSLLIAYQAISFLLFAWIVRRLDDRFNAGVTFIAPVVYVAIELVVPFVFPWYLAITQAWVRPVIQIADLTGPLGVSFLIVLVNAALFDAWRAWRSKKALPTRRLALAAGLFAACMTYGQVRIHQVERSRAAAPKLKVGVVQANIGIKEKWNVNLASEQLRTHQQLSRLLEQRGAELVVWPESSYPFMFRRDQAADWPVGDARRARYGFDAPLLFGTLTSGGEAPYPYNSAMLLDRESNVRGLFDKNILMVFGEYIPFYEQLKFVKEWIPETSNWARGTEVSIFPLDFPPGRPTGTVRIGPMICYEDIFPSFGRRLTLRDPNLLINITNDAWFGRTSEPYEHLALAVYRAVESRLDLVRAVNTGVSAFVDSTGKLYDQSPSVDPDETPDAKPATLLNEVAVQQPFKLYALLGEWFGALCLILAGALGLVARARGGQPVRWRLVAIGAAALAATIVVSITLLCGPSRVGVALDLLMHRATGVDLDSSFAVGVRLVPAMVLGCIACGVLLQWLSREVPPRLEATLAVLGVLVVPATLTGSLEGEQAGLVISALVAIALTILAQKLSRRWLPRS